METTVICPSCRKPLAADVPLGLCPECLIKSGFKTESPAGNEAQGFVAPSVEELAGLFPQFEIVELVGIGGMGAVYKARQPGLDRVVALKILPPHSAADAGFAERFNREARALARLNHPNIVAVHDFGRVNGLHYLVMEFVDGANLRQLQRAGQLTPEQAFEIVPQICDALHFAHGEGIVHRDIKPENILLDKRGRVKITDFGIAKILGHAADKIGLTSARDVVGTPHYMAPEQIENPQRVDHRADIYSLGVVFYEMLTGELPIGKFAVPSRKVQVDVRLDHVVLHALEKEPARRYQRINEVKTDVETIARNPGNSSRARAVFVGVGAAAVLSLLLGALILLKLPPFGSKGGQRALTGMAAGQTSPHVPPVIVKTVPESGAKDVDHRLKELRVTFSKPMQNGRWSWVTWEKEHFPELVGQPGYLADQRTCVAPVKLQPGKVYAIWINSDRFKDFTDTAGQPAVPYLLIFETRK